MQISIENMKLQKRTDIQVEDDFFTDAEDMIVDIGMDRFKLVSMKTEEDKQREALAIKFGEAYYSELYSKFPNFGEEGCLLTVDALKEIIKSKLTGEFEALANDKNPELVITALSQAYANYCKVRTAMDKKDGEIEASRLHENVFFDYLLRFKKLFGEAETLKQISDGLSTLHEYASVDKRDIYGYSIIFNTIRPYLDWAQELDNELKTMSPYKPISQQVYYDDPEYFKEKCCETIDKVIETIESTIKFYTEWMESTKTNETPKFKEYLELIIKYYNELLTAQTILIDAVKVANDKDHVVAEGDEAPVVVLEKAKQNFNDVYNRFIIDMLQMKIHCELDTRKFNDEAEHTVISSHFALVDHWLQTINRAKNKAQSVDEFCRQLRTHTNVLTRILNGELDVTKLVNGQYTSEELTESSTK